MGLHERLLQRDIVEPVHRRVAEFVRAQSMSSAKDHAKELAALAKQRDHLAQAIAQGGLAGSLAVAKRLAETEAALQRLDQQAQPGR